MTVPSWRVPAELRPPATDRRLSSPRKCDLLRPAARFRVAAEWDWGRVVRCSAVGVCARRCLWRWSVGWTRSGGTPCKLRASCRRGHCRRLRRPPHGELPRSRGYRRRRRRASSFGKRRKMPCRCVSGSRFTPLRACSVRVGAMPWCPVCRAWGDTRPGDTRTRLDATLQINRGKLLTVPSHSCMLVFGGSCGRGIDFIRGGGIP